MHVKQDHNTTFPTTTYAMLRGEFCMWEFDNVIELWMLEKTFGLVVEEIWWLLTWEDTGTWETMYGILLGVVVVTLFCMPVDGWIVAYDARSEVPVISLGLVGDIMVVDDMEDSANEDSGEAIPRVLRLVDDLLHAALSTIHCWQLELNLFAGRAILTPLLVSLSHSYPRGDTANSSWLQMTAFPLTKI